MESADQTHPQHIKERLSQLAIGDHADFPLRDHEEPRRGMARVGYHAHMTFGKGNYRLESVRKLVRIQRLAPPEDTLLTRKQALVFLRPWFPQGLSYGHFARLCQQGAGPAGERNGKSVLFRRSALRAWAEARLQPIDGAIKEAEHG